MRGAGLFLVAIGIIMLAFAYWSYSTPMPPLPRFLDTTVLGTTLLDGDTPTFTTEREKPAPPIFTGLAITFIIAGTVLVAHATRAHKL